MMDMTPRLATGAQRVESYGPSGFRIGGVDYATSVLVTPEATQIWPVRDAADITLESLAFLTGHLPPPEVLLIGTGMRHEMINPELRAALRKKGMAVDSMDTGAACRTFNVLLSESRRVAAALLKP